MSCKYNPPPPRPDALLPQNPHLDTLAEAPVPPDANIWFKVGRGFEVWGVGFGFWGLGYGVWGGGFGAWGLGLGVWGLGFGVWGLGLRV
jgi:hypothetical protein